MSDGLTLEKAKIADRMTELEKTIGIYISTNEIRIKNQEIMIEKLNHILTGNGQPGLDEKVRNLQSVEEDRKKHTFFLWTAIAGTFITAASKWVTGFLNKGG